MSAGDDSVRRGDKEVAVARAGDWMSGLANRVAGGLTREVHEGRSAPWALGLVAASVVTTVFAGALHALTFGSAAGDGAPGRTLALVFAGAVLAVLGTHEWGLVFLVSFSPDPVEWMGG